MRWDGTLELCSIGRPQPRTGGRPPRIRGGRRPEPIQEAIASPSKGRLVTRLYAKSRWGIEPVFLRVATRARATSFKGPTQSKDRADAFRTGIHCGHSCGSRHDIFCLGFGLRERDTSQQRMPVKSTKVRLCRYLLSACLLHGSGPASPRPRTAPHEASQPFRPSLLSIARGTARSDVPRMRRRPGTFRTHKLSYRRLSAAGLRIAGCPPKIVNEAAFDPGRFTSLPPRAVVVEATCSSTPGSR